MGAIPNRLPGFQDILDDDLRRTFEQAWGCTLPAKYGWHLTDMFEAMGRGDLRALYVLGENPAQSEADVVHARPPAGRPRPPRRAGHLPDQDRRDGRRGAAGVRGVVRERRHRHQQRAPGAAGPQGPRSAGRRPRRHLDPPGDRPPARPRLARRRRRGHLGRGARPVADAPGHVVRPAGGAGRHPVALLPRRPSGAELPPRPPLGRRPGRARPSGTSERRGARAAGRRAERRVPPPPHHRPPPRQLQHRRADERLRVAAARRRDHRRVARGRSPPRVRRGRSGPGHLPPGRGAGAGRASTPGCDRAWPS